ncbi:hypothetical protein E2C01_024865 [Portunus trituberculatus]|uniref:Uncharacterized protein n=1 Tax=Portunus trituberculatus TaxID=210409 RepID=A0A5B7EBV4_PORTR|nr:hypothetical protein [Portunus trituberculatus]
MDNAGQWSKKVLQLTMNLFTTNPFALNSTWENTALPWPSCTLAESNVGAPQVSSVASTLRSRRWRPPYSSIISTWVGSTLTADLS